MRVLWLLEELGLSYSVDRLEHIPGQFGGSEYTKIHPLNKVPAFKDGNMVMFESVAIMQYIMDKYAPGKLSPSIGSDSFGPYLQWLHYGESSLAPVIATLMYQRHFFEKEKRSEHIDLWAQKELSKMFSMLEYQLGKHEYILKDGFSAADISVGYCLLLARLARAHDQITERVQEYWEAVTDRDAWSKISNL